MCSVSNRHKFVVETCSNNMSIPCTVKYYTVEGAGLRADAVKTELSEVDNQIKFS